MNMFKRYSILLDIDEDQMDIGEDKAFQMIHDAKDLNALYKVKPYIDILIRQEIRKRYHRMAKAISNHYYEKYKKLVLQAKENQEKR